MKKRCLMILTLSIALCFLVQTVALAAPSRETIPEEAEERIREYFEALSEGDIQKMNECSREDVIQNHITAGALKESGMEAVHLVELTGYPLDGDQEIWYVAAKYEVQAKDISTGIPDFMFFVLSHTGDDWYLSRNEKFDSDDPGGISGRIEKIYKEILHECTEWQDQYIFSSGFESGEIDGILEWQEKLFDKAVETEAGIYAVRNEAKEQIEAYYEAYSEGDTEKAASFFREGCDDSNIVAGIRALKECGMQKISLGDISGYPLDEDLENWLFVVGYEMRVKDIRSGLPGLVVFLADHTGEGWYLSQYMGEEEETSEEQISLVIENEKIMDECAKWDQMYVDVVAENDDEVTAWLEKLKYRMQMQVYMVKPDDCLWSIAEAELGDGMRWAELYEANQTLIGSNPDLILPGWELYLP